MPTSTYDLIASNVLTSSASSVTFSSIPATYRDLIVVVQATGNTPLMRFNSDTGSNYSRVVMYGDGSSAISSSSTLDNIQIGDNGSLGRAQIMDYSATDKHKSVLIRRDLASSFTWASAHRWANTSVINNIEIYGSTGSFSSGSTFYLYGIVS